ncbi:unnamed protein product [Caenorhabditis bovis]|uniref:Uncharacterized protein n=1 Tax=Caenorhabditis bovis TaxID=2654633 RepID=A0A8S1EJ29_9PELO|nr:unnamed protein product [Caenorhabditis bovis]
MSSILVYDREHNFKKWFVYWIPKSKTLGVKDAKDVVYEKEMTVQDRMDLLNVTKTLLEDKWSDLFAECGLHIESVADKEIVLSFALERNVTLEKAELTGDFDELLYLEYLRMKTMLNSSPTKRKRTASAVDPSTSVDEKLKSPELVPLKKRITRSSAKSNGPQFEEQ